jgi:acyl carrier protein
MDLETELSDIVHRKTADDIKIAPGTKLAELGLDSLDLVEIVFEIEDRYKIQLSEKQEDLSTATVKDLCALVEGKLGNRTTLTT